MEFAAADDSTVVQISGSSNNSSSCCFEFADQTMDLLGSRHCRNSSSAAQIITADSSSSSNNNNNTTTNKSSKIMVEREHMFDKAVTPSDVGKLNRLVIPKQHAERFFPLDPNSTDKGLLLCFEDSAGKSWRFRYSYWNSSQSYVLTKGWSRFVKDKKLDAGDIVSFERERHVGSTSSETQNHHYHSLHQHRNQRLFISWRRRPKPNHHTNHHHHHHHDIPRRNFHHHHLNPNFHHQFSRNNSPFCIQNLPHFNGAAADVTIMSTSTSVGNNSNGGSASSLGLPLRCIPRWLPFLPSENPPLLSVPVPVPVPVPVHMNLQMVTAAPPSQSSPYLLMEPPAAAAAAAAMMNTKAEEDYSSSSGREQSHAKKGSVRLFGVNLESAEENNNVDDDDEQQQQLERTSKNRISSSSSVLHSAKTLCVGPRAVLDL